jgi:hypothetical protein
MEKLLIISITFVLSLTLSCKKSESNSTSISEKSNDNKISINLPKNNVTTTNKVILDGKKFYLLSKDNSNGDCLKKFYFEQDMQVYQFSSKTFKDRTGAAIMEPLEYNILKEVNKKNKIQLIIQNKWSKKVDSIFLKYDTSRGLLYRFENGNVLNTFVDSLFISSIKIIYVPPCKEYKSDEDEVEDCLNEYVKDEEEERIRKNNFSWYPRLDCKKYFDQTFCKKLNSL